MRLLGKTTAASILAILLWTYAFPYMGEQWFRKIVDSGEKDGFSYSVEAHRFQGRFVDGWPDLGFTIRLGVHKWYDEADYQLDFGNMYANRIEFARVSGDNL
jgi:hypothetical protein